MRQVTLAELGKLASDAREDIWTMAQGVGREPKVYLHWSAGRYDTQFDDYHININGRGTIFVSTEDLADVLAHTYKRNTGAIGVALDCAYGATTKNLGDYAPTDKQIEVMAQVIQVLCDALWLTIDKEHVMTHGEAADNEDGEWCHEPYGVNTTCERWDLEFLGTDESPWWNSTATDGSRGGDVLRGKALWYKNNQ